MRRVVVAASLTAMLATARCTCSGNGTCDDDADCAIGNRCRASTCVVDARKPPPSISSIDGTGQALAPVPSGDEPANALPAAHRTTGALVVAGAGLDAVTDAFLEDAADDRVAVSFHDTSADGASMTIDLPSNIAPGLFTLTLLSASAAAQAQVFLLQGEPGAPAHRSLTEGRAAEADECPGTGGTAFLFGVDDDDDGQLGATEITSTHVACDNGPDFDCGSGVCVSALPLQAPQLAMGPVNAPLPVVVHVVTPRTLAVPGEFANVRAALASLDGVQLDALVTILVSGTVNEPEQINVTHPDGRKIRIIGAGTDALLQFGSTASGIVCDGNDLGDITNITLDGAGGASSVGVLAANGAVVAMHVVTVRGFASQVVAENHATIVGNSVTARDGVTGILADHESVIAISGADVTNASGDGLLASGGSLLDVPNCGTAGNGHAGLEAVNFSIILATSCDISENLIGLVAIDLSLITSGESVFTANGTDVAATVTSAVRVDNATGVLIVAADPQSQIVGP